SPPRFDPLVKMLELDRENGRLQGIESEIPADIGVMVFRFRAVNPHHSQASGEAIVIGDDHASIAEAAEVLCREEAETGQGRELAYSLSVVIRADRLRSILDDRNAALRANLADRVHLGRLAEKIDRHDGLRLWRNGPLDATRLDIERG